MSDEKITTNYVSCGHASYVYFKNRKSSARLTVTSAIYLIFDRNLLVNVFNTWHILKLRI